MAKMEDCMLINFNNEMMFLLKYKLSFFLNSRPKKLDMTFFSFKKDINDKALYLKLRTKNNEYDLIRWTDNYPSIDETMKRMESRGYSVQDLDTIKVVLSRIGYIFRIETEKKTNRDLKLFFFILQMNRANHNNKFTDEIKTELLQSFLCELFLHYETFSRFKYVNNEILFLSDHLGYINFIDMVNEIHNKNSKSPDELHIKLFHIEFLKYISSNHINIYKELNISFDDDLIEYLNPDRFIDLIVRDEEKFFRMLSNMTNPMQSTQELFISNLIFINYTFFILKHNVSNVLNLKKYIDNECYFTYLLKLIINRTIMLHKSKFISIGLSEYLSIINNTESEQIDNVLTELIYEPLKIGIADS